MNQPQREKNSIIFVYGLFFLTLIVLLGTIFPTPYFYVLYDSEPEYFANIVSVYINGYPLDFLHPGIPVTYIASLFLSILPFNEDPEYLLLASRVLIMAINFSLIYLGLLLINRASLLRTILFISFLFIFPASNYFIDILSPNGILMGVGLITCILGLNLGAPERSKSTFFWYGVALAIAVSIKFHSILLIIPSIVASLFFKKNDTDATKPVFLFFLAFVTFVCIFGIITYPVLPLIPFWLTHFSWYSDLFLFSKNMLVELKGISLTAFLGGFAFVAIVVFLMVKSNLPEKIKNIRKNTTYKTVYLSVSSIFLLGIIYNLIGVSLTGITYNEIGDATRNSLPFLGFLILFLPRSKVGGDIKLRTIIASAILISLISFKGYKNYELYKTSSKINLDFRSLIEESLVGYDYVVFFPNARFISKDLFLVFSDYRYGERSKMFEDQVTALPFKLDPNLKPLRMLNSRYFNIPKDISSKFSYRYINKLLSTNYLSDAQRGVLENSLYSLKNKDICKEPYDGFKSGDTFSLVIPDDLTYMEVDTRLLFRKQRNMQVKTGDSYTNEFNKGPNKADKLIKKLTSAWENECGFEISSSKIKVVNNKELFILGINSLSNIKR